MVHSEKVTGKIDSLRSVFECSKKLRSAQTNICQEKKSQPSCQDWHKEVVSKSNGNGIQAYLNVKKVRLFQHLNQCKIPNMWSQKKHDHVNRSLKGLWLSITFAWYKNFEEWRARGIYLSTMNTIRQKPEPKNAEGQLESVPSNQNNSIHFIRRYTIQVQRKF